MFQFKKSSWGIHFVENKTHVEYKSIYKEKYEYIDKLLQLYTQRNYCNKRICFKIRRGATDWNYDKKFLGY